MSKERDVEILKYKIDELTKKISTFNKQRIDAKKRQALELQKLKYEDQLAEIELQ